MRRRDLECLTEYIRDELNLNNNEISTIYKTQNENYSNLDLYIDIKEKLSLTQILNNIERKIIIKVLNENNWNISKSSKDLNIIRQSLIYRIKKLDIVK